MANDVPKETAAGRAKVSPARNILGVILLILFSTTAVMEFLANRRFSTAVDAIQKRMPKEPSSGSAIVEDLPTQVETETILGRSPDGPLVSEDGNQKATYTWQGLLRKHVLTAYYTNALKPHLIRVATDGNR